MIEAVYEVDGRTPVIYLADTNSGSSLWFSDVWRREDGRKRGYRDYMRGGKLEEIIVTRKLIAANLPGNSPTYQGRVGASSTIDIEGIRQDQIDREKRIRYNTRKANWDRIRVLLVLPLELVEGRNVNIAAKEFTSSCKDNSRAIQGDTQEKPKGLRLTDRRYDEGYQIPGRDAGLRGYVGLQFGLWGQCVRSSAQTGKNQKEDQKPSEKCTFEAIWSVQDCCHRRLVCSLGYMALGLRAFKTAATEDLCVALGIWPLDLEVRRRAALYRIRKEDTEKVANLTRAGITTGLQVRKYLEEEWQDEGERNQTGRRTHKIFPSFAERFGMEYLQPSPGLVHFITGHGPYKADLFARRLTNTGTCDCGREATPEHVVLGCIETLEDGMNLQIPSQASTVYHILRDED
uniref:Reverse transcriptase n=1 Tax=Timema poppense TaxID=170557 RepID=A0A7R9DT35_TIMPO|nr:unnamed protein product [Timema poppensis]